MISHMNSSGFAIRQWLPQFRLWISSTCRLSLLSCGSSLPAHTLFSGSEARDCGRLRAAWCLQSCRVLKPLGVWRSLRRRVSRRICPVMRRLGEMIIRLSRNRTPLMRLVLSTPTVPPFRRLSPEILCPSAFVNLFTRSCRRNYFLKKILVLQIYTTEQLLLREHCTFEAHSSMYSINYDLNFWWFCSSFG